MQSGRSQLKLAGYLIAAVLLTVGLVTRDLKLTGVAALLGLMEIGLSFDNAAINAGVLKDMDAKWQRRFLLWGILVAVFGMRLVIPILIVSVFGAMLPWNAFMLAINDGHRYGEVLHSAHWEVGGFGAAFLGMVFLTFITDEQDIYWLKWIERPLIALGNRIQGFSTLIGLIMAFTVPLLAPADHRYSVTLAMLGGIAIYLLVDAASNRMEGDDDKQVLNGIVRSGLAGFIYLEVLDASFSMDGVIGAFALSSNVLVIMAGLGMGALAIRALTIFLVRGGHLDNLKHLEHSAHYSIGALAFIMCIGVGFAVPEIFTGLIGIVLIGLGVYTSLRLNKRSRVAPAVAAS